MYSKLIKGQNFSQINRLSFQELLTKYFNEVKKLYIYINRNLADFKT